MIWIYNFEQREYTACSEDTGIALGGHYCVVWFCIERGFGCCKLAYACPVHACLWLIFFRQCMCVPRGLFEVFKLEMKW